MPSIIPKGLSIRIVRWKERQGGEALHNRYILTDIGGVLFAHGLDRGKEGQQDDVFLMELDQYLLRWQQYAGVSPAFDMADPPISINGIYHI